MAKYHSCVVNWQVFPLLPLTFWPVDLMIWWISLMICQSVMSFLVLFTMMAVRSPAKSKGISDSSFWISHMHLTSDLAQPCLWVCKTPSGNDTWVQAHEVIHTRYSEHAQDDMQGQQGWRCVLLMISAGKRGGIRWPFDPGVWGSLWVIRDYIEYNYTGWDEKRMDRLRSLWDAHSNELGHDYCH